VPSDNDSDQHSRYLSINLMTQHDFDACIPHIDIQDQHHYRSQSHPHARDLHGSANPTVAESESLQTDLLKRVKLANHKYISSSRASAASAGRREPSVEISTSLDMNMFRSSHNEHDASYHFKGPLSYAEAAALQIISTARSPCSQFPTATIISPRRRAEMQLSEDALGINVGQHQSAVSDSAALQGSSCGGRRSTGDPRPHVAIFNDPSYASTPTATAPAWQALPGRQPPPPFTPSMPSSPRPTVPPTALAAPYAAVLSPPRQTPHTFPAQGAHVPPPAAAVPFSTPGRPPGHAGSTLAGRRPAVPPALWGPAACTGMPLAGPAASQAHWHPAGTPTRTTGADFAAPVPLAARRAGEAARRPGGGAGCGPAGRQSAAGRPAIWPAGYPAGRQSAAGADLPVATGAGSGGARRSGTVPDGAGRRLGRDLPSTTPPSALDVDVPIAPARLRSRTLGSCGSGGSGGDDDGAHEFRCEDSFSGRAPGLDADTRWLRLACGGDSEPGAAAAGPGVRHPPRLPVTSGPDPRGSLTEGPRRPGRGTSPAETAQAPPLDVPGRRPPSESQLEEDAAVRRLSEFQPLASGGGSGGGGGGVGGGGGGGGPSIGGVSNRGHGGGGGSGAGSGGGGGGGGDGEDPFHDDYPYW
jgi:hypothetical protein